MAAKDRRHSRRLRALVLSAWILSSFLLAACGASQSIEIRKIALLAPFEGRHRELGYNAFVAVRLAISDAGLEQVQLLPVDEGGDIGSATLRMRALNLDSAVVAIIALGDAATHPSTQRENDKPLILIGNWGHDRADEDSLYATDRARAQAGARDDLLIARRMISGKETPRSEHYNSNGSLSDAQFVARFINSDQHVPRPNWLATLVYDMTRLALSSISAGRDPSRVTVSGLNGEISFRDGYWNDAPLHQYRFQGDDLVRLTG